VADNGPYNYLHTKYIQSLNNGGYLSSRVLGIVSIESVVTMKTQLLYFSHVLILLIEIII